MNLPFDPLREAILLQLNRAISIRRAQGASFEALEQEFGLPEETLRRITGHDDGIPEQPIGRPRSRSRSRSRLLRN
jgi:hypothetical protein